MESLLGASAKIEEHVTEYSYLFGIPIEVIQMAYSVSYVGGELTLKFKEANNCGETRRP